MDLRLHFSILTLLLCAACVRPPTNLPEESFLPPEPSTVLRQDEQYRKQFRLGLEELPHQQTTRLEKLQHEAPDTIWGTTARQILILSTRLDRLNNQFQQLQTSDKQLNQHHKALLAENLELKKKLEELTRLLVELEKRPH